MITALTIYINTHHLFGAHHFRGSTLLAAFMHRYHQDSPDGTCHLPFFAATYQ